MAGMLQAILPADWFTDVVAATQQVAGTIAATIMNIGFIGAMFVITLGVIFYFTGFNAKAGKTMVVNGIVCCVVLSIIYVSLFGAQAIPDISSFFAFSEEG